jgi:hypothetical protein
MYITAVCQFVINYYLLSLMQINRASHMQGYILDLEAGGISR